VALGRAGTSAAAEGRTVTLRMPNAERTRRRREITETITTETRGERRRTEGERYSKKTSMRLRVNAEG
jgi:hypothetical protein